MIDNNEKWTYFQYVKEMNYPVFVKVKLSEFDPHLLALLMRVKFSELDEKEVEQAMETLRTNRYARLLTINEATMAVARQIDLISDSDRYGFESIIPKETYNLYRHKGVGVLIYSFESTEWEMGCFSNFGEEGNLSGYCSIMNRFLSWALAPIGVIGFWGVPVDEGMVSMKQMDSKGEAIFIDVKKNRFISIEGHKRLSARFKVIKLDSTLLEENKKMTPAQLLSYLSSTCTYMDYFGHSVPIRQMLLLLSKKAGGIIHPKDSFKPRTDLSV